MKIELKCNIKNDLYSEYIYNAFDIQNQEETITNVFYNLGEAKTFNWNIGIIIGGSGSGKSTILNKLAKNSIKKAEFDNTKSLISNFDWLSPEDATKVLTSMGLSSVPTWLRPFNLLSNGEQYRASLAYIVAKTDNNDVILIDEYTSVVDRDVAKAMSYALQKYIRKTNKRIILASCHYDILEWLMPDWTCSPSNGGMLQKHDYLRQGKPEIELQISRTEPDTWKIFKQYHYLTENVNKSCKFLLFEWDNKPVAFCGILNTPGKGRSEAVAISRIVVLPDYQGMGIGSKICNFVGGIFINNGHKLYIKTVNPALGEYFNNSPKWRGTTYNGKGRKEEQFDNEKYKNRVTRISYAHEYVGKKISGFEHLLLPIGEMRKLKIK